MRIELIKCEECDATHRAEYKIPHAWIETRRAGTEMQHFCSLDCLKKHLGVSASAQQSLEQPQTKMRRFLLADGETAEEFEGVLWGNGCVALTPENVGYLQNRTWSSWDSFKHDNQGCGITWIDQEAKEEVSSNA